MTATVVRYQAKPDRADENQQLIEAVFADLDQRQTRGLHLQGVPARGRRQLRARGDRARRRRRPRLAAGRARVPGLRRRTSATAATSRRWRWARRSWAATAERGQREHGLQEVEHDFVAQALRRRFAVPVGALGGGEVPDLLLAGRARRRAVATDRARTAHRPGRARGSGTGSARRSRRRASARVPSRRPRSTTSSRTAPCATRASPSAARSGWRPAARRSPSGCRRRSAAAAPSGRCCSHDDATRMTPGSATSAASRCSNAAARGAQ